MLPSLRGWPWALVFIDSLARCRLCSFVVVVVASKDKTSDPSLFSPPSLPLSFAPAASRHDFLKQIYRYMIIAYQDNGLQAYGKRMTIDLVDGTVSGSGTSPSLPAKTKYLNPTKETRVPFQNTSRSQSTPFSPPRALAG
jgi:hypothetical protein